MSVKVTIEMPREAMKRLLALRAEGKLVEIAGFAVLDVQPVSDFCEACQQHRPCSCDDMDTEPLKDMDGGYYHGPDPDEPVYCTGCGQGVGGGGCGCDAGRDDDE